MNSNARHKAKLVGAAYTRLLQSKAMLWANSEKFKTSIEVPLIPRTTGLNNFMYDPRQICQLVRETLYFTPIPRFRQPRLSSALLVPYFIPSRVFVRKDQSQRRRPKLSGTGELRDIMRRVGVAL